MVKKISLALVSCHFSGALVSCHPGRGVLLTSPALADARGGADEVLRQGHHYKVNIIITYTIITVLFFNTINRVIEDQEEKEEALVKFFCQNVHNKYSIYFFGFIACEVMVLIILMILMPQMTAKMVIIKTVMITQQKVPHIILRLSQL